MNPLLPMVQLRWYSGRLVICCPFKRRNGRNSYEFVKLTRNRLEVGLGKISLKMPFLRITVLSPESTRRLLVSQLQTKPSSVKPSSGCLSSCRNIEEKASQQGLFESSSRIAPPGNCSRLQTVRMTSCNNYWISLDLCQVAE